MAPATEIFKDIAPIDPYGYLIASDDGDMGCEGVFAAGDCRKKGIRQISTATSDGACAALAACKYVDSLS
jgi:thioredoxin reductase (NADPH)